MQNSKFSAQLMFQNVEKFIASLTLRPWFVAAVFQLNEVEITHD
jgi:hypothetical protein